MSLLPPDRLSDLIGAIYDCAIDPASWPDAMREICVDLRCSLGAVFLVDLQEFRPRFVKTWNFDPSPIVQDQGYADDVMFITMLAPVMTQPLDEPMATSRLVSYEKSAATRYVREVSGPGGYVDSLQTVVLRNSRSIGLFATVRHESIGFCTDEDCAILGLLAPHIRRAITISDLLDLKTLEVNALSATLDRLAMGVVVVTDDNRILHANEVARGMLSDGGPIASRKGRLAVHDSAANKELTGAIEIARRDEAAMGATGIAVPIGFPQGKPAIAHVLPLTRGDVRSQLMPQATAAVFVTAPEVRSAFDLSVLRQTYGLTPAEIRVCEHLTRGRTPSELAEDVGVSISTVKTHMTRIFSKLSVSRQADLIALIHRIAPPIRRPRA
jgi:DNA-binding CsgD family transcriptional regulator